MSIWNRVSAVWRGWRSTNPSDATTVKLGDGGAHNLALARESLTELLDDERLPAPLRAALSDDYAQVRAMLDKLEQGHLHIAAFGRVSTGKSSLLNALVGEHVFSVSALHGETRSTAMAALDERPAGGLFVIDTPGIDEADGESREQMAEEVARRADIILFCVDSDLTDSEFRALETLAKLGPPLLLVLNKADRYTDAERDLLLEALAQHTEDLLPEGRIIAIAANPSPVTVVAQDAEGNETTTTRERAPDLGDLRERLWRIAEQEGKTLAALNASLFAADLSDKVGQRLLEARGQIADELVRTYCIAKGVAVAVNPLPVADLFAAAAIDVGMVVHLSRVFALPLSRNEAGQLVRVISTEALALMGTVWAVHFVSSALKVGTAGLSTLVTAGAQGAVAYYGTYVVGQVARNYLAAGCSWGEAGPKQVVRDILDGLDRDSILQSARDDIRARLRGVRQQ
ncbi:MAG: GTP-binding protein [Pseudomonadota bacterium]